LKRYLNIEMIFGMGLVWDGTKYLTARDVIKDSGPRIENYRMERLFVMNVIRSI
jgi:hypothetical protein